MSGFCAVCLTPNSVIALRKMLWLEQTKASWNFGRDGLPQNVLFTQEVQIELRLHNLIEPVARLAAGRPHRYFRLTDEGRALVSALEPLRMTTLDLYKAL